LHFWNTRIQSQSFICVISFLCLLCYIIYISSGTTIQSLAALPPDVSTLQNIPQAQSEQQATEAAQHATELIQHTMNVTIIATNISFLIEEINTMACVRAFKDKGITCFYGLDGTLERQQRAERFLTILEKNDNLLDQLLDILREQGMTYVLGRLNSCRNAYSAGLYFVYSCFAP
jgi:hypothetical protein